MDTSLSGSSLKRTRSGRTVTKHHRAAVKQPNVELVHYGDQDGALVEQMLRRAVCIALHSAGFTSAEPAAMESLLASTQEYMVSFSRQVAQYMRHGRRSQPLPQDFTQTLAHFDLRSSLLLPDLDLNIPAQVTQLPLLPPTIPPVPSTYVAANVFDKQESSTTTGKIERRYIPSHFPSFPSEHTFRTTPVYTQREIDARRIREQATQEGMQAEKALRKLMAASKAAASSRRRGFGSDTQRLQREEVWRETLDAVKVEDDKTKALGGRGDSAMFSLDGASDMPDAGMGAVEVNYDRMFERRGRGLGT